MKKRRLIATLAALGLATSVYAGNGMGCGGCGHQGDSKGMQQRGGDGMMQGHCRGKSHKMQHEGMEMMSGKGMKHNRMGNSAEGAAQGRGMHGQKMKHNGMMRQLMAQLDLSDAQKQKIQEIKRESRQSMKQRHRKPEMDFGQFMSKDRFDKEAFKKTMQQKWEARDKMQQEKRETRLAMMSDHMAKIFDVLTPEQREKLIELKN